MDGRWVQPTNPMKWKSDELAKIFLFKVSNQKTLFSATFLGFLLTLLQSDMVISFNFLFKFTFLNIHMFFTTNRNCFTMLVLSKKLQLKQNFKVSNEKIKCCFLKYFSGFQLTFLYSDFEPISLLYSIELLVKVIFITVHIFT